MNAAGDGDGGGGGGEDKPLTKDDIVKLVNETVNGTVTRIERETKKQFSDISGILKELKEKVTTPPAAGSGDGSSGDDGEEGKSKAKADPKVLAELETERRKREKLEKQVADLIADNQNTKAASELASRHADIKTVMSKFSFASDGTRDMAFDYFASKVKRSEDGSLVGPGKDGEVPFDHFIKSHLESNPNLLAAKQSGGAGAQGGEPHRGSKVDASIIRPGMSDENRKAAAKALLAARPQ